MRMRVGDVVHVIRPVSIVDKFLIVRWPRAGTFIVVHAAFGKYLVVDFGGLKIVAASSISRGLLSGSMELVRGRR